MHISFSAALLTVCCLCALSSPAEARRRKALPRTEWWLTAAVAAVYDDNLLRLSERDQRAYLRAPAAFPTPLKSVDDLQTELHLAPEMRWRAPRLLMVGADYRLKAVNRVQNEFSSYQTHSLGLSVRPRVQGYRWAVRARMFAIPSYYLRTYTDRDYAEKHAARFSNRDYEGALRFLVFDSFWLEGRTAFGSYYYNSRFTEYDSEYREGTLGGSYAFPRDLQISGSYTRRLSENIGKLQPFNSRLPEDAQTLEDSEHGDSDFNEDEIGAKIGWAVPWLRTLPLDASLSYRMRRRVYVTERTIEMDPLHRGRLDYRHEITLGGAIRLNRNLRAQSYFTYEERRTESPAAWVSDVKSFIRRQVGVELSYMIR